MQKNSLITPVSGVAATIKHSTPGMMITDRIQYKLVVFPEGEAGKTVRELAKELMREAPAGMCIHKKPYVAVAAFEGNELMEPTLIRWIQRVCNSHYRFTVWFNNFGTSPAECLHLRIMDAAPFLKLISGLKVIENYIHSNSTGKIKWSARPVCSLVSGSAEASWFEFILGKLRDEFHASFRSCSLVLLKSPEEGSDAEDEVVNVFPLYP